jgi:hypothetical protein
MPALCSNASVACLLYLPRKNIFAWFTKVVEIGMAEPVEGGKSADCTRCQRGRWEKIVGIAEPKTIHPGARLHLHVNITTA